MELGPRHISLIYACAYFYLVFSFFISKVYMCLDIYFYFSLFFGQRIYNFYLKPYLIKEDETESRQFYKRMLLSCHICRQRHDTIHWQTKRRFYNWHHTFLESRQRFYRNHQSSYFLFCILKGPLPTKLRKWNHIKAQKIKHRILAISLLFS